MVLFLQLIILLRESILRKIFVFSFHVRRLKPTMIKVFAWVIAESQIHATHSQLLHHSTTFIPTPTPHCLWLDTRASEADQGKDFCVWLWVNLTSLLTCLQYSPVQCRPLIDLGFSCPPMYKVSYLQNCFSWSRSEVRAQTLASSYKRKLSSVASLFYSFLLFFVCFVLVFKIKWKNILSRLHNAVNSTIMSYVCS